MESKGLGDTIKKITGFFGIPTCKECQERADYLNALFPYGQNRNIDSQKNFDQILELIEEPATKHQCKQINALRCEMSGICIDSCFCTPSQRAAFIRDVKNWIEDVKQGRN